MPTTDEIGAIRSSARIFEEKLPADQRKRLGQFFTGLPLGKLLAHLALSSGARSVIDPMAGHGDLLDAATLAAKAKGFGLSRLDGIELDSETAAFCCRRMAALQQDKAAENSHVITGSAFDPTVISALDKPGYDLVITNPPYVRYQLQNADGAGVADVRRGLSTIIDDRMIGDERVLWQALVSAYSGLADLSVPAWLLSALLTRPGGRLAIVVPATWRSRDYADVVRYLLLRLFHLEYIVEDTQPGWFSDALVRTHLVIARRLSWDEAQIPVSARSSLPTASWVQIAPAAASKESLVGATFHGSEPERNFAAWAGSANKDVPGIERRPFVLNGEWRILEQRLARKVWFKNVEDRRGELSLIYAENSKPAAIPEILRNMLPPNAIPAHVYTLEQAGIRVSQGLRSGCNRFFYVTMADDEGGETVTVETSDTFDNVKVRVPAAALRPVLHRQVDMQAFADGSIPATRVLALSDWVLPEDQQVVAEAAEAYRTQCLSAPRVMPPELASFVRLAAQTAPDPKVPAKFIPDLSAVRTNVRRPVNGRYVPRFWYMLPAFTEC